ncbi:hypothetical protein [Streptomyces hydrogenans]
MSAREELFRRVAGAFVSEDRANKLIDDVIAEAVPELEKLRARVAELEAERDAHRKASGCTCIDGPELDAGKLLHSSYCATLLNLAPSVPQQRGEVR